MQQGFVICTKAEGVTVTVADDATGAVLPLGDNGFGGITAELVDGFYRVETRKGNAIQGWYLAVTNGKVSDQIKMYSTVPDLCAFRPCCNNFVAPESDHCQACLDAIAFEVAQAESEGDEEEPDEYDDQHWRVGMDGYDEDESEPIVCCLK